MKIPVATSYKIIFSDEAKKYLEHLEQKNSIRILSKIQEMSNKSINLDIKKLKHSKYNLYRLRVGKFRIIYSIEHNQLVIYIVAIGHRSNIYEKI